jgi:DNA-binding beta-propeller fold protein YncE
MISRAFFKWLALLGILTFVSVLRAGDVALSDGQNAEDVVGQFDGSGNPLFDQGSPFNSQRLEGFNLPYDVQVDTVSHRLFILDYSSNRIMVYDLDSSNTLVDRTADHVLGQTSFYNMTTSIAQNTLSGPVGFAFDGGSNRLFVSDNGRNRVIIFDVASITDGEDAVNVLGQVNFTSGGSATTINGMKNPQGVVYDVAQSRLFVSDTTNHRILVFDLASTTNGENAVNVLGQADFTSASFGTAVNKLSSPRHIAYDLSSSRLFVADYTNSRVMVFDVASITDGENAVNVLGQSNFTSSSGATAINRLNSPFGVVYSSATQRLFVGDSSNNRVAVFDVAAITDGENAVNVLGQSTFTTKTLGTTQVGMYTPRGLAMDDGTQRLFVVDQQNYRVTVFDVSTTTLVDGENAANVVGQTDGAGGGVYTTNGVYDNRAIQGMNLPYDVAVDTAAHRLFVSDYMGLRVLEYDLDTSNTLVDRTPDHVLGQLDFTHTLDMINQYATGSPAGLAFDPSRNLLFVSHYLRNRVMVFDVTSITDGENAINVLGQPNFTVYPTATTQSGMTYPWGLSLDLTTNLLYVGDYGNHRVTVFDVGSITNGENAVHVLGQPDFTTGTSATTASGMYSPRGVHAKGNRLYVADTSNNRVLVFDTTVISNGESAVSVLGQTTFTTKTAGITASSMYYPFGATLDFATHRLFVSDYFNDRVLTFDVTAITDGEAAVNVIGQSNFISGGNATTQNGMYIPTGLTYESGMNRLYVAELYNNRVSIHSVGPVPPSTSTLTAVAGGQAGAIDLSWPSAGDDGPFNALTGNYRVQYATYTATWSTGSTPTDATTLTIATTSVTPGVVQSTTIAGLTSGMTYYFALFTGDEVPNWSDVSNTASAMPPHSVTLAEAVGQAGWMGRGDTQRILGTAQVVSDSSSGVTISSVAVQASGYTADGNLTNVEVWVSSSGYIDANAIRLENTAKAFSSNLAVFTQDVVVSTTPLYFVARSDVSGSATEGTFEIALQVYTTAVKVNNPIAFSNATDVVAPPSGAPSGLSATASGNLLQVNLTWGAATGADSYTVFRATHSGVTTTDFLLGMTNTTSFADDYIPPAQQMYYKVLATNRAGSTASGSANATSVDIPALTTSNIYLRAGTPSAFGDGYAAVQQTLNSPYGVEVDFAGNLYIGDTTNNRVRFVPKISGTYFGQGMVANNVYTIAGTGAASFSGDGGLATSAAVRDPNGLKVDRAGNVYIADTTNHRIRMIPKVSGTYFGQSMTANYIYTIAGSGTGAYGGDGGAATAAQINTPTGVTVDLTGNIYICDNANHRIRFIANISGTYFGQAMTANYIYTIAGDGAGSYGGDGGAATSAQLFNPYRVAVDVGGSVYIADQKNNRIRMIAKVNGTNFGQSMTANAIYTLVGDGTGGGSGDGGAASAARVNWPTGVSVDGGGNVLISDYASNKVRFIPKTSGTYFGQAMTANYIYKIAGTGAAWYSGDGGVGTAAKLNLPIDVQVDAGGNVYIADTGNKVLRFIPKNNGTYFGQSMTSNYIYSVTRAGGITFSGDGILATDGTVNNPYGVTVDASGNIYLTDPFNYRVRFIPKITGTYFGQSMTANFIYTIAGGAGAGYSGDGGPATSAKIDTPAGISVDVNKNVYFVDYVNHRIRFVPVANGTYFGQSMTANYIYTIAGNGTASYGGDGGSAISAQLKFPFADHVDASGNLYIADRDNHRIRFVPVNGGTYFGQSMTANFIYTIAGNGTGGYVADNVAATGTPINIPRGVVTDTGGNLYISEFSNHRIRFVPKTGGTYFGQSMTANFIYTIAGNGTGGYVADNVAATAARINTPSGVSVDAGGNVYISDTGNNRIRFVPKIGGTYFSQSMTADYIYTIGGTGSTAYTGENAPATGKNIYSPFAVFAAPDHMVYTRDANNKIRMIAAEDFIAPSTSTLAAVTGSSAGKIDLSWASAGDDMVNLGNLTGSYRIQYATYTAAWSTGSTPTDAFALTIATTSVNPGVVQSTTIAGLTSGMTYYFALFTGDEVPNWSDVSNTASAMPPSTVTLAEAVGQAGWTGQGETQRILGTAQVVSDSSSGVTISSVAVQASGYTADGNLTNVEVWVSSSGYIDANAIRLDGTAKAFSSNVAVFDQDVGVSTTPLYFIARSDVSGSATEGTFEIALQVYTTALKVNNPIAFSNATDVVAPPSGAPSGLTATAASNLLQINLSWGSVTGVDSYTIYQATHSGVTTTDYLLGMTNNTNFADDYIPPAQQMYYKVLATNRAGSTASGAANATSVDVPTLATSNIYLRAGLPGDFGDGNTVSKVKLQTPSATFIDHAGNVYIADAGNNRIRFVPKTGGTYFGQAMTANSIYTIAGNGTFGYVADNVAATSTRIYAPYGVSVDVGGNVYIADRWNNRIRFVPKTGGTYFGQAMTANNIYTIAGNGTAGYVADNVSATSTQINLPYGVSVDSSGNVYIGDYNNNRIRFVPKTGGTYFGQAMTANYIYTIAGNGTAGYVADNVAATSTQINKPNGVSVDVSGNIYIADSFNNRIRFFPKRGGTYFGQAMTANYIYTIAGNGTGGYLADNVAATSTRIYGPSGVSVDASGNVHIADYNNNRIRFVPKTGGTYFGQAMTANYIYTIAGNGTGGYLADNVAATSTRINGPFGVSVDASGNVYIADSNNNLIRFVPKTGGTHFGQAMTANYIYTTAGNLTAGYLTDNVNANATRTYAPSAVSVDASGNIYIADSFNHRIRFVPKTGGTYFGQAMTANYIYTIAGNGTGGYLADNVAATSTGIYNPFGVSVDASGNVYIADYSNHRIRFIPKTGGTYFGQAMTANYIYTIAGNGTGGYLADNVAATSTRINSPFGVIVDASGNVYIGDTNNHRIRFVPKTGGTYFGQAMTANYIYTIAGNGTGGYLADNVAATSTRINGPSGVSVDASGNVYIADTYNHRIRFVPKTGGTYFGQAMTANYIYTIAGNGTGGYLADNVAATSTRINGPSGVSVDASGNVYIADSSNHRIRFVPKTGGTYFGQAMTANYIYTIGGTGNTDYNGENSVATGKDINSPNGIFPGPDHMVYLTDYNNKIRMIAGEDFIAPSTSTLAATAGLEEVTLSWNSAGDDAIYNPLTGNYRIQYATYTATWSTGSTPTDATTVTIATTSVTPGAAQTKLITGLTGGTTYYFVLWSQDEVNNWSDISNTTSTIPIIPIRSVTITFGDSQAFGAVMMGSVAVGSTGTVVSNDGNLANTYVLRGSTQTPGSPWTILASTPTGPNQLVIFGVFDDDTAPVEGDFDPEDVIGPTNQTSSGTAYSVSGSTTGASVPAGQDRTLWIRMDMPTTTTTVQSQSMKVEITAQPP